MRPYGRQPRPQRPCLCTSTASSAGWRSTSAFSRRRSRTRTRCSSASSSSPSPRTISTSSSWSASPPSRGSAARHGVGSARWPDGGPEPDHGTRESGEDAARNRRLLGKHAAADVARRRNRDHRAVRLYAGHGAVPRRLLSPTACALCSRLCVRPGHPFPYMSNKSKSFASWSRVMAARASRGESTGVLPRFIIVPPSISGRRGLTYALLEDVIRLNLGQLFPGMEIADAHLFRIIRETDIVLQEDGAVDLLESVDQGLRDIRHGPCHSCRSTRRCRRAFSTS